MQRKIPAHLKKPHGFNKQTIDNVTDAHSQS